MQRLLRNSNIFVQKQRCNVNIVLIRDVDQLKFELRFVAVDANRSNVFDSRYEFFVDGELLKL